MAVDVWPDGTAVAADPCAEAERLQAATDLWSIWYGRATRHFWAASRQGPLTLLEGVTTGDLVDLMTGREPVRR